MNSPVAYVPHFHDSLELLWSVVPYGHELVVFEESFARRGEISVSGGSIPSLAIFNPL